VPKILSFAVCYFKFRIGVRPAITGSSGFASSGTSRIPLRPSTASNQPTNIAVARLPGLQFLLL